MSNFRELQSGDAVRITRTDQTTLDCNIRRLLPNETLVVTTPLNENNPDLQTTYYIGDYVEMVYPIPA